MMQRCSTNFSINVNYISEGNRSRVGDLNLELDESRWVVKPPSWTVGVMRLPQKNSNFNGGSIVIGSRKCIF